MRQKWFGLFKGFQHQADLRLPVDLMGEGFFASPETTYAWLRKKHPIAPVKSGGFILSRFEDIVSALSDSRLGNAPSRFSVLAKAHREKWLAARIAANIPPFLDAPDHSLLRKALTLAFHKTFDEAKSWIPELAYEEIGRHKGKKIDLIHELARPFACSVMARFVGLPNDVASVKAASDQFFYLFAPITDRAKFRCVNEELAKARMFISEAVSMPCQQDMNIISLLQGSGLTQDQIIDNALLILADGIENIEAAIAMTFDTAYRYRHQIPVGCDKEKVALEALRLSSPVQTIPRVAREDCCILAQEIRAGQPVFLALGSANLDSAHYSDPLEFHLERKNLLDLTFGRGRHSCIGAPLARLMICLLYTSPSPRD